MNDEGCKGVEEYVWERRVGKGRERKGRGELKIDSWEERREGEMRRGREDGRRREGDGKGILEEDINKHM